MMRENDSIEKIIGKENPFKVPEGYFEGLTQNVMQNIKTHEIQKKKNRRFKIYRATAAIAIILVIAGVSLYTINAHQEKVIAEEQSQYMEQALDYAMISNDEIYSYLAEEY